MLKKIHIMYVRSEIEREDNDRILNTLNEGLLILQKDESGEAGNIILMNKAFKRFIKQSHGEQLQEDQPQFSCLQEKNLLLHSKDFLLQSADSVSGEPEKKPAPPNNSGFSETRFEQINLSWMDIINYKLGIGSKSGENDRMYKLLIQESG